MGDGTICTVHAVAAGEEPETHFAIVARDSFANVLETPRRGRPASPAGARDSSFLAQARQRTRDTSLSLSLSRAPRASETNTRRADALQISLLALAVDGANRSIRRSPLSAPAACALSRVCVRALVCVFAETTTRFPDRDTLLR